jgi:glycosyltransferase involved in cell wall biosynthesis
MIWLASFPRSGNTFFRNILYEVYGLESSTYHQDPDYFLDPLYAEFPVVKTHLLPGQLLPADPDIRAVYIIRDGRDAMVSLAHHRKDIIAPGSDFYENLKAAIIAEKGSFFGGWSRNINEWIKRADIIIRYEDLLTDPIGCAERLRAITSLPEPDRSKLPRFEQLKEGVAEYGSGKGRGLDHDQMLDLSKKNFRKGKAGGWKDEMPEELADLFWSYHGDTMLHLGYSREGSMVSLNPDLDHEVMVKLGHKTTQPERKYKVLIEGDKLFKSDNDGVKRYQTELLRQFEIVNSNPQGEWSFDIFAQGRILPLDTCSNIITEDFSLPQLHAQPAGTVRERKTLFQRFEYAMLNLIPDGFVHFLRRNNINFLHKTYDGLKKLIFGLVNSAIGFARNLMALLVSWLFRIRDYRRLKSLTAQFDQYDLIHLPLQQHFVPFRWTKTDVLVTVHDFTHRFFPEHHTSVNIHNAEAGLKFIEKKQAHMLAVSLSTLNDARSEITLDGERLHCVYEAINREKFGYSINHDDNRKVMEKYGIPIEVPYLLSLSTLEPRKNLEKTIQAFMKLASAHDGLHLNLVIAGKKGWMTQSLFTQNKLFTERVHFTGFVDDADLAALYSEALALTYMSYYEGFGLPPLEAMSCGTPVVYSNRSSLPEIIGDAGLPADPDDVDGIMRCFGQLYLNPGLRAELGRKALKRSLDFSWRQTAIETLDVYRAIIERNEQTRKRQAI